VAHGLALLGLAVPLGVCVEHVDHPFEVGVALGRRAAAVAQVVEDGRVDEELGGADADNAEGVRDGGVEVGGDAGSDVVLLYGG
jgi:hypothetical protein